ncbi:MAG TPA: N-acetyltransferase [Firmicutes bacterium]|nr:N-acetyltransferase [Bacillota bacterium]
MELRKARMEDVKKIHKLINAYAERGMMLPRSLALIYENLREFAVAEEDGEVIGTGGLHIVWGDLAEIRAVAVREDKMGQGVGKAVVRFLIQEAADLGIPRVFALTYKPAFFEKCGFRLTSKDELPQKVWKDCINCPKFPNCDEVAMIYEVDVAAKGHTT